MHKMHISFEVFKSFALAYGDVSFGEKDGLPQIIRSGEYHRLYVEGKRIVIDGLVSGHEGY